MTCGAIALLLAGLAWACWRLDRVLRARPTPDGSTVRACDVRRTV